MPAIGPDVSTGASTPAIFANIRKYTKNNFAVFSSQMCLTLRLNSRPNPMAVPKRKKIIVSAFETLCGVMDIVLYILSFLSFFA